MLGDGVGSLVAQRIQLLDQSLALDAFTLRDASREWRILKGVSTRCEAALAVATSSWGPPV